MFGFTILTQQRGCWAGSRVKVTFREEGRREERRRASGAPGGEAFRGSGRAREISGWTGCKAPTVGPWDDGRKQSPTCCAKTHARSARVRAREGVARTPRAARRPLAWRQNILLGNAAVHWTSQEHRAMSKVAPRCSASLREKGRNNLSRTPPATSFANNGSGEVRATALPDPRKVLHT